MERAAYGRPVTILLVSGAVDFSLYIEVNNGWLYIGFAALFTFLYSAPIIPLKPFIYLRKIAYGKTIFLALAWTYVTAMHAAYCISRVTHGMPAIFILPGQQAVPSLCRYAYYLICKDRAEDRKKKIKALPTVLSEKSISIYILPEPVFFPYLYDHDAFFRDTPSCICFYARSQY